jgi:hypothetical protein
MTETKKQEFLREFLRDAEFANNEVKSWPIEVQVEAAKTGVLEFPRTGNLSQVGQQESAD